MPRRLLHASSAWPWHASGEKEEAIQLAELIGIPHRLVVSDRGLEAGELEYRHRRDEESRNLNREEALKLLKESAIS